MEDNRNYNQIDNAEDSSMNSTEYSFPVNLSKEEYIEFNLILSKFNGAMRFRKGQLLLFTFLAASVGFNIAYDAVFNKSLNSFLVILLLFLLLTGGILYFGLSSYIRMSAGKAYDQMILNGNSYLGRIVLYPNRIEKQRQKDKTTISLNSQVQYIETKTMIILYSPGLPAIVVPSAYVTPDDVREFQAVIFNSITASNKKVINPIIPKATEHIPIPENQEEDQEEEQLYLNVTYTQQEFVKLAADTAGLGFMKALPIYSALSFLSAMLFSYLYNFGVGAIVFVVVIVCSYAFNVLSVRAKAGWVFNQMQNNESNIGIRFTDKGITIKSPVSHETIGMIWESITRAVERRECVEFYTKSSFLRIPKHCIHDFNLLKQIVDSHVHSQSASK